MHGPLHDPLILKRLNYYSRLRRLVEHMKAHIDGPMDLTEAARVACMERTAFSRFFSKSVGMTYREFVQQWRIAIAVEQMLCSDCSLTDLAYAAGFPNMNTFDRTFKKITMLTPSEYRKRLLADHEICLGQKVMKKSQGINFAGKGSRSIAADV